MLLPTIKTALFQEQLLYSLTGMFGKAMVILELSGRIRGFEDTEGTEPTIIAERLLQYHEKEMLTLCIGIFTLAIDGRGLTKGTEVKGTN